MARLYADEDFPHPAVDELRQLGHDVTGIHARGRAGLGIPDAEVLELAAAEGRAVLTRNRRHFIRLHRDSTAHAGIIVCTQDNDPAGQAARVHAAVEAAGDLHGQLIRVNRPPAGS